jgi:hypothetical protein
VSLPWEIPRRRGFRLHRHRSFRMTASTAAAEGPSTAETAREESVGLTLVGCAVPSARSYPSARKRSDFAPVQEAQERQQICRQRSTKRTLTFTSSSAISVSWQRIVRNDSTCHLRCSQLSSSTQPSLKYSTKQIISYLDRGQSRPVIDVLKHLLVDCKTAPQKSATVYQSKPVYYQLQPTNTTRESIASEKRGDGDTAL